MFAIEDPRFEITSDLLFGVALALAPYRVKKPPKVPFQSPKNANLDHPEKQPEKSTKTSKSAFDWHSMHFLGILNDFWGHSSGWSEMANCSDFKMDFGVSRFRGSAGVRAIASLENV